MGDMLNMPDLIGPNARKWLENRDFKVGREAKEAGYENTHAVMLIPGVISSGLESWGTDEETAQFFRKRLWGGGSMVQAIVTRKQEWIKAMSLDPKTGLDPPNVKVRSAQGLDAASYFITGYWIWSKIIENLAAINYDYNDLSLQAYDWRLSYYNLQVRDAYFSRIKGVIEHSLAVNGKKTVLVSHSMGGSVTLWFLKWVEAKGHGGGGSDWVEKHIDAWVNIGGCMLGVPKAMAAFMSGEVRMFPLARCTTTDMACADDMSSCFHTDARYRRIESSWCLLTREAILEARACETIQNLGRCSIHVVERRE